MIRSFQKIFQGTFLSKASGLARDIALASAFGTSLELSIFFTAFRFALIFRRIFGETLVSSLFIPRYQELVEKNPSLATTFYRQFQAALLCVVCLFVLVVQTSFFFFPAWAGVFSSPIRILSFSLIFLSAYATNSAYLQCHDTFFFPAIAPLFFNLALIIPTLLFRDAARMYLPICALIGFFFQWLVTIFSLTKPPVLPSFTPFTPQIRSLVRPFFWGVLGIGTMQVHSFFDALFAQWADPRGPSYLWFAIRLYQAPVSLFSLALSTAFLPHFSSGGVAKEESRFLEAFRIGLVLLGFSTFGLLIFSHEVVATFFQRGAFDATSVQVSARCLQAYCLGLLPSFGIFLSNQVLFTKKRHALTAKASLLSVLVNIAGNLWFVFGSEWGALGVAFSTAISQWIHCAFLAWHVERWLPNIWRQPRMFFVKIVFGASSSALIAKMAIQKMVFLQGGYLEFLCLGGMYGGIFLLLMRALQIEELKKILT
ncbi:MAG: lipid II flippase MurJ [Chlamydiota bacterium]